MNMDFLGRISIFIFFLFVVEVVFAKTWLSPEIIDNTESADGLGNISAAINQNGNLYVAWENVINEAAPHSYNIFWKLRYRSLNWSDSFQLTDHPFDTSSGALYPNMDWNIGRFSGDNVYLTYSSAGEGYIHKHMATGTTTILDASVCGSIGNGAAFDAEEHSDYHVLYLKCPEFRLYHKMFIEAPAELGWGTATVLSDAGKNIFSYDIAVDNNRNIHVVWSEQVVGDIGRTTLQYKKYTDGSDWDADATSLTVASTITGIDVEVDLDGNVHVVWRELDPSDHPTEDIIYKTWHAGVWSHDINLSNGDEHSHHPSMTVTSDNNVHVVWIAADRTIAYRKWDGDWQPTVHLSEGSASHPFITSDSSKNLYLFYSAVKPPSPSATQLKLIRYGNPSVHTPEGSDIRIELDEHSITFDEITESGVTTIISLSEGSDLSADYSLACTPPQYFDIETTARYRAPIDICLGYDDSTCDESELQLIHNLGDRWEDITTSVDTDNNIICGRVLGGLSEFSLAKPATSSLLKSPKLLIAIILALIFVLLIVFKPFRRP